MQSVPLLECVWEGPVVRESPGPVHTDLYLSGSVGCHVSQGASHRGHKLGMGQGRLCNGNAATQHPYGEALPQLGSAKVEDRVGMSEALVMLATSLRARRNLTHIQWDTMHKTRTWLNNAHNVGREYSYKTAVRLDWTKQYVTTDHTSGKWFGRFMKGVRM